MTECLQHYVVSQSNCSIGWFRNISGQGQECTTSEEFENLQRTLNWLFDASYTDVVQQTGCVVKCSHLRYDIVKHREEEITWNTSKWISEFYIYSDSDHLEVRQVFSDM